MKRASSRSGLALVLVLLFLVLISGLVVAFFDSARVESRAAVDYRGAAIARQLGDTAVNLAQAQISDGTRSLEVPGKSPGASNRRLTWCSQPGLIRTFDDAGRPGRSFKLYSARSMVEEGDYVPQSKLASEVPDDWPAHPALFTDLNAPVLVRDPAGTIVRASEPGVAYTAQYPVLDPGALGAVAGFKVNPGGVLPSYLAPPRVPGFSGALALVNGALPATHDPSRPLVPGRTANPAPMPVRWLYVLADGKLTAPDGAENGAVFWSEATLPAERPSEANPIVGRVAFWTDDESCKLNINTASEGTFWDRPWANSNAPASPFGEQQLRDRLPVRDEFQRYPGHPATVCLSPVLAGLKPAFRLPIGDNFASADYDGVLRRYYDLVPRIGTGGTRGGTVETGRTSDTATVQAMVRDENRLYASLDELMFAAPDGIESKTIPASTAIRSPMRDAAGVPLLERRDLERAKFFLTASSRAPDVNLLGRPRVALWMLQQERDPNAGKRSDTTGNRPRNCPTRPRNAKDDLLAWCSTIGGKFPFYFQRYSIYLGTEVNGRKDVKKPFGQLPRYGYEPPSSQYPALDWQLTRNQQLYGYLQQLTDTPLPGWGAKLTDKYPAATRDQLLTQMVDLIRFGTNSYAQDTKVVPGRGEADVRYEYAPARRMPNAISGETQIAPLIPPGGTPGAGTKGFGRFPTITEAALIFYASEVATTGTAPRAVTKMRALLVLEPFTPTAGSWTWSPLVRYRVSGLNNLTIGAGKPFPETPLENLVTSRCGYGSGGAHNTAYTGTFASFRLWNEGGKRRPSDGSLDVAKIVPLSGAQFGDPELHYNFVSDEVTLPDGATQFAFGGGDITVEIHTGFAETIAPGTLVQRVRLRFPAGNWPVPRDPGADKDFNNRIGKDKFNLVHANDTVRSVEVDPNGPTRGDLRLVSALRDVPASVFAGYDGKGANGAGTAAYASTTARAVHSLRNGNGTSGGLAPNTIKGELFPTAAGNPIVARGLRGAFMDADRTLPGDWDNGPWDFPDGAYINKPDDYYGSFGGGDRWEAVTVTPNRQVWSPVVFGSLPVGVLTGQPWRTLLFCANPAADRAHPGFAAPRDHLFLDFFSMPVVEPYAISEPCSTAGKVNLNCELAPFTYIHRDTALHGVLKSTRLTALPTSGYKGGGGAVRRPEIDATETLAFIRQRFAKAAGSGKYQGDAGPFRTASEICDVPLVPLGTSHFTFRHGTSGWWGAYSATGDNAREAPYGAIYSRVTTKSNVFTVHFRAQAVRQRVVRAEASEGKVARFEFREDRAEITGDFRGATTLERYVDPADPNLPDFATAAEATLDDYYRWRVVATKRFNP